jgi:hypothetical protein
MRGLLRDEQRGQSVVLIGGRRCGKTSVLDRLHALLSDGASPGASGESWRRLVPDAGGDSPRLDRPHLPVKLDMEGNGFESYRDVIQFIADKAAESVKALGIGSAALLAPDIADAVDLQNYLVALDRDISSGRYSGLAFLVDEIESIFGEPWCANLLSLLRALVDSVLRTRLWVVLVGSDGLDSYRHPRDGSPPLNVMQRTLLPGLDYSSRKRMTQEPFVTLGMLPPHVSAIAELDRLAAGNVWLVTHLLDAIYEDAAVSLESVTDDLLTNQFETFERWAAPLDETAWSVYRRIASAGTLSEKEMGQGADRLARRKLVYQALIHERLDGSFEIGPELFRRWAEEQGKIRGPFAPRRAAPANGSYPPGTFRYDVALSYASRDKPVAENLARQLRGLNISTFFDQELQHDLWGIDLARALPSVYDREARVTLLLVSNDYVSRRWPLVEARAAIAKSVREGWDSVLLVSLDGARLPEVPDSVVWLDLRAGPKTVADIAVALASRFANRKGPNV